MLDYDSYHRAHSLAVTYFGDDRVAALAYTFWKNHSKWPWMRDGLNRGLYSPGEWVVDVVAEAIRLHDEDPDAWSTTDHVALVTEAWRATSKEKMRLVGWSNPNLQKQRFLPLSELEEDLLLHPHDTAARPSPARLDDEDWAILFSRMEHIPYKQLAEWMGVSEWVARRRYGAAVKRLVAKYPELTEGMVPCPLCAHADRPSRREGACGTCNSTGLVEKEN